MVQPKYVLYCDACGMPPEYCKYGPDFESHCSPWLLKNHPQIYDLLYGEKSPTISEVNEIEESDLPARPWSTEERLTAFYTKYMPEKLNNIPALIEKYKGKEENLFSALVKKYGEEPEDPYYVKANGSKDEVLSSDNVSTLVSNLDISGDDKKKRRGASAKKENKVDTRVIIQKILRNRKKAVTIVVGMDTVPGVKLKDASKAFSKRFAGSSSVKETVNGGKEIIIQGDHSDEVASMLVDKFNVPSDSVFLDIDGEFVPYDG